MECVTVDFLRKVAQHNLFKTMYDSLLLPLINIPLLFLRQATFLFVTKCLLHKFFVSEHKMYVEAMSHGLPTTKRGKRMNIECERQQEGKKIVIVTVSPLPQSHSKRPVQQESGSHECCLDLPPSSDSP